MAPVEWVYVASGMLLPLFYLPQMLRFRHDESNLHSYSLSKSMIQSSLRFPALVFGLHLQSTVYLICVTFDLLGRLCELGCAIHALRRQGNSYRQIFARMSPFAIH